MSELTDLAAKIDAMSLDELKTAAVGDTRPAPGGEYDTVRGWANRCSMSHNSKQFTDMWKMLIDAKLAEPVQGRVMRSGSWTGTVLYRSASLARKLAD